jgi:hypothetical protein
MARWSTVKETLIVIIAVPYLLQPGIGQLKLQFFCLDGLLEVLQSNGHKVNFSVVDEAEVCVLEYLDLLTSSRSCSFSMYAATRSRNLKVYGVKKAGGV